ncbi:MAG: hypothetical protein R8G66_14840 [Cytophagales bacterium]|nr:hypothetical protein [Cytophagales bacterium]
MMNMDQLEHTWQQQDQKLDRVLEMNQELLRKINFETAHRTLKKPLWSELVTLGSTLLLAIYLLAISWHLMTIWQYSIPGLIASSSAFGLIVFSSHRIKLIRKAQDLTTPISILQRHLATLQLKKIKLARIELILGICAVICMWPIIIFTGFGVDIYHHPWMLGMILLMVAIIAIPVTRTYERSYHKSVLSAKAMIEEIDH